MRNSSIFQRLMEQPLTEAREAARQEGIERGIEHGERKGAVDALMVVLDVRFQDYDVQILKPTFEAITDLQHLKQLLRTAAQASTIGDITRALVPHRNNGT